MTEKLERYCEICEMTQPSFTPKCYSKEDNCIGGELEND